MFTDNRWKCTNKYEAGWGNCDFDDNHWPNAVELALKDEGSYLDDVDPYYLDAWNNFPISSNAHWIWTEQTNDTVVYCRKLFPQGM